MPIWRNNCEIKNFLKSNKARLLMVAHIQQYLKREEAREWESFHKNALNRINKEKCVCAR